MPAETETVGAALCGRHAEEPAEGLPYILFQADETLRSTQGDTRKNFFSILIKRLY